MLSILWPRWLIGAKSWLKRNEGDLVLGTGIFLVVIFVFLVGRVIMLARDSAPLVIQAPAGVEDVRSRLPANLAELALPGKGGGGSSTNSEQGSGVTSRGIPETEREGRFVASRNGKKYYWPDSSWAARIKPENRVWFNSEGGAESRGYQKSSDFGRFFR